MYSTINMKLSGILQLHYFLKVCVITLIFLQTELFPQEEWVSSYSSATVPLPNEKAYTSHEHNIQSCNLTDLASSDFHSLRSQDTGKSGDSVEDAFIENSTASATPSHYSTSKKKHGSEISQIEGPSQIDQSEKELYLFAENTIDFDRIFGERGPYLQHLKEISINFNNISLVEYIRFISRISNKNFIFDEEDLQFTVTIISQEPTTIDTLITALLQELKIRDLLLLEQGNNIIIYRNPRVRGPARMIDDGKNHDSTRQSGLVTRLFRLKTLDPVKAIEIIRPLLSDNVLLEVLRDTNNFIITDLVATVNKVAQLIEALDAPANGATIGQYVARNAFVDSLVDVATSILQPIAQSNPFVLIPHPVSNSIFIVSNAFIVERAIAILQNLDLNEGQTKILSLEELQPSYEGLSSRPEKSLRSARPQIQWRFEQKEEFSPNGEFRENRVRRGNESEEEYPIDKATYESFPFGRVEVESHLRTHSDSVRQQLDANRFAPGSKGYEEEYPIDRAIYESFPLGRVGVERHLLAPSDSVQQQINASRFAPGTIGSEGRPSVLEERRTFTPGGIGAPTRWSREIPIGHIERTMFLTYKLRYRKGDQIEIALRKIANSLQSTGRTNADLIAAIKSTQWIESSNSLIITGTPLALEKIRELILEVDSPLRQVFIEMLILDTTIDDALSYGVDWIARFGGGTTAGEQGFLGLGEPGFITDTNNPIQPTPGNLPIVGDNFGGYPSNFFTPVSAIGIPALGAYTGGVIGTHLTHHGIRFSTIGALVRAIHTDTKSKILLNPKIITEDNNTAEIFVGGTDRYKTQSITTADNEPVTNNFQFIDVGTTLRVTPFIGNNDIIAIDIIQETSATAPNANSGGVGQDYNLVEILTKSRSVTKLHVPNGFFVVLSGMIRDLERREYQRIPCLGGIPFLGAACKNQLNSDRKRNLMLFIRPLIVDSQEELENITKRQQEVFSEKTKFRRSWNYEIDEGLNFLNLKPTDPDEISCDE